MIVLDTQCVSQIQRNGSREAARLNSLLTHVPLTEVWITVITPYEQFRSALGLINSAKTVDESLIPYALLSKLLDHYASRWPRRVLPFDRNAATIYPKFAPRLIRQIGPRDGKIAAITLSHQAILLTANVSDFRKVPGLAVEDWLREDASGVPIP